MSLLARFLRTCLSISHLSLRMMRELLPVVLEASSWESQSRKTGRIFRETVIWLRDEGFIKFGISDFQYEQPEFRYRLPKAKLTYKGLEALKSIPDPLNPTSSNTLADSLVDGAKEGTKGAMSLSLIHKSLFLEL